MNDELYRLWLSAVHQIGSRKQNALLEYFGSARAVFNAPVADLRQVPGLTPQQLSEISKNRSMDYLETLTRDLEQKHIVYISREHASFPALLKQIPDPPVGLFYLGELPGDDSVKVGLIGSRRCSEYGLSAARMLSKPLAKHNVVIVSGMARGIDSMAHKGALEGGGKTIAVLGCGVDRCYPAENRALREDIIRNGCVLSEYPPGTGPIPAHFPARNRIISGMCEAIVVVEAAGRSGTLITVDQAQDQGREVMAVPGSIVSRLSEGTNQLIKDGATPVTTYQDILAQLGIEPRPEALRPAETAGNALAPDEKVVYDSLTFEPVTFDELLIKTNSQSNVLNYLCTMLELKGFIKKLPGLRYIRNI